MPSYYMSEDLARFGVPAGLGLRVEKLAIDRDVHQDRRIVAVIVPRVVGRILVAPSDLPGVRIDRARIQEFITRPDAVDHFCEYIEPRNLRRVY